MTRPLILRRAAERDIADIRDGMDAKAPGLSDRFAARLRELLARIERTPELFGVVWQDVRAVRVKKFPHVVHYVAFSDRVEVLAVLHGA